MVRGSDGGHRGLSWTGERALPWGDDLQVIYEHYHRYLLAALWVAGKDVLDLGCGEGYGSDLLGRRARTVVGLDIAPDAVTHAQRRYGREGVGFVAGSMTDAASVEPGSCDVVVCFEALEHVVEQQELVSVVRKALRPGGLFVTSTPERSAYNEDRSGGANPHHLRELDRVELQELLGDAFDNVTLLDQRVSVGSLVTSASSGPAQAVALVRDGDGWVGGELPAATYLLALASDGPLPEVPRVSVLVDPQIELVRGAQRERDDLASQRNVLDERLAEATARADRRAADASANADVLRLELGALQQELRTAWEQARELEQHAADLRQRVDHLESSRLYRGYRALRAGYDAIRASP